MNKYYIIREDNDIKLEHHGIKGQRWGIRRFQNEDGSLTEEGKQRYYDPSGRMTKEGEKALDEIDKRDEKYSDKMFELLKKYDSKDDAKGKYFDEDGNPYDDYINYISDLKKYAESNGHKNVDKKDIASYNKMYEERKKDIEAWRYLLVDDRSKQHDLKAIGKDIIATTLFPLFGIALIADIGRAGINAKERKIYSKK